MEKWEPFLVFCGIVVTFLTAVASLITSMRNGGKINEVHLSLNSRLDQLVASEKSQSRTEGEAAGRAEAFYNGQLG